MAQLWKYLNSPKLVFEFQQFFGIKAKDDKFEIGSKLIHWMFLLGTELGN